jgi:hypothetical protein
MSLTTQPLAAKYQQYNDSTKYIIGRSLRLRGASGTTSLSRTVASSGNRKKWTISLWLKNATLATGTYTLFSTNYYNAAGGTSTYAYINANQILWTDYTSGNNYTLTTNQFIIDPSGFIHLMFVLDTDAQSPTSRCAIYINGARVTSFSSVTYPTAGYQGYWNAASSTVVSGGTVGDHRIGVHNMSSGGMQRYLDGYISDFNFIDGQALTPSSFGMTDLSTGSWVPKKYIGSYGTNGFFLNFNDVALTVNSNVGLGKDLSVNGNYWVTNSISVTPGYSYDSMIDTPTNNFCIINPVNVTSASVAASTVSNGNLIQNSGSGGNAYGNNGGTIGITSGKWYFEASPLVLQTNASGCFSFGFTNPRHNISGGATGNVFYIHPNNAATSYTWKNGAYSQQNLAAFAANDIVGVAFDRDNLTCQFYKNGVAFGNQLTGINADVYYPVIGSVTNNLGLGTQCMVNFGQYPFAASSTFYESAGGYFRYAPPTGHKALCTANL